MEFELVVISPQINVTTYLSNDATIANIKYLNWIFLVLINSVATQANYLS